MRTTRRRFNRVEFVLRVRHPDGWLMSEHIERDGNIELISYFPNGVIQGHMRDVPVTTWCDEITKVLTAARAEDEARSTLSEQGRSSEQEKP